MDWEEALDLVVARTGHARYRELCAAAHPENPAWRARMIERAAGEPVPAPEYPPLVVQAGSALAAAGRVAAAIASGSAVLASPEVVAAREDTCRACPSWDPGAARCRQCGCHTAAKRRLATERCPEGRW